MLDNRDLSKVSNVCIPSCSSTLFLPTSAKINKIFYQTNRGPYSGGSRGGGGLDNRDLSKVSNVCIPLCSSTLFLPTSAEINKIFYQRNRGHTVADLEGFTGDKKYFNIAGRVTYNFHLSCKHMHLSFKSVCNKEHKGVICNMTSSSNSSQSTRHTGRVLWEELLVLSRFHL